MLGELFVVLAIGVAVVLVLFLLGIVGKSDTEASNTLDANSDEFGAAHASPDFYRVTSRRVRQTV